MMLDQCCCKVADAGQTITQLCVNVGPTHGGIFVTCTCITMSVARFLVQSLIKAAAKSEIADQLVPYSGSGMGLGLNVYRWPIKPHLFLFMRASGLICLPMLSTD